MCIRDSRCRFGNCDPSGGAVCDPSSRGGAGPAPADVYKRQVKHSVENSVEKQAIFENHHEPIIDRETWERVQELRKQRKRPNRYDEVGLFSGMLFCADCGHVTVSYTHLGNGNYSSYLAQRGASVVAFDYSKKNDRIG